MINYNHKYNFSTKADQPSQALLIEWPNNIYNYKTINFFAQ